MRKVVLLLVMLFIACCVDYAQGVKLENGPYKHVATKVFPQSEIYDTYIFISLNHVGNGLPLL